MKIKKNTLLAIEDAIFEDDNACQIFGGNIHDQYEDITEEEIINAIYNKVLLIAKTNYGENIERVIHFDGTKNIKNIIKKELHNKEKYKYLNS